MSRFAWPRLARSHNADGDRSYPVAVLDHSDSPPGLFQHSDVASDLQVTCDVVIVGSGAGGATMADDLSAGGLDVVVLEEGGYHSTSSFTSEASRSLRALYRDGGLQLALGTPPVMISEGRCVGGSTVINGGMSWRTPERILERWTHEEHVDGVTPREMEPYFRRIERRISVGHQDPETIGRDAELLKLGADAKGWNIIANERNQLHCAGSNNCVFGCPTGAKRSMLVTSIPRALARGARVYADCHVERVTRQGARATGVEARVVRPDGTRGPKVSVRAAVVVVSAGAVQTPALLMRSGVHPPSGQLGRHLTLHPSARLVAIFDEEVNGWQGVHQAFQVREFIDEGILITAVNLPPSILSLGLPHYGQALGDLMQSYNRMVIAGCLIDDQSTGRVKLMRGIGPFISYQIHERDVQSVVRGIALTAELMFAAGARRILLPFAGVPDLTRPSDVYELQRRSIPKRAIDLFSVHVMGTARMSDDPSRGVVSSYGEVHGASGLFVSDASLFPTSVGVNPMETILALSSRNARWLLDHRQRFGL